jgi:hypothetical protein
MNISLRLTECGQRMRHPTSPSVARPLSISVVIHPVRWTEIGRISWSPELVQSRLHSLLEGSYVSTRLSGAAARRQTSAPVRALIEYECGRARAHYCARLLARRAVRRTRRASDSGPPSICPVGPASGLAARRGIVRAAGRTPRCCPPRRQCRSCGGSGAVGNDVPARRLRLGRGASQWPDRDEAASRGRIQRPARRDPGGAETMAAFTGCRFPAWLRRHSHATEQPRRKTASCSAPTMAITTWSSASPTAPRSDPAAGGWRTKRARTDPTVPPRRHHASRSPAPSHLVGQMLIDSHDIYGSIARKGRHLPNHVAGRVGWRPQGQAQVGCCARGVVRAAGRVRGPRH